MPPALYKQGPAAGPQSAELPGPQTPSMLGRKRTRSSEAHGCPPWRGTPQSLSPPPRRRQAPPTRRNAIAGIDSLDGLIDAMQRLAVGPPPDAVQPKRVCLPGGSSSGAAGCPPQRGTPQSPSTPPRGRKSRPRKKKQRQRRRRRRNTITPPATSVVSLDPLIEAMQRLTIGTPPNAVQAKPVCPPGSSRSSDTGGCPPWRGTARSRFLQPSKGKAPLRSLRKDNRQRRRNNKNIPPRARKAMMAFAHTTIIIQCPAVGTSGNSMGPRRAHLARSRH